MENFKRRSKFIMVFFDNMPSGITLTHGQMLILSKMEKDNTLRPLKHVLESLSIKHSIPYTTLKNNLEALKRDKIVIPKDKALYMANPYLFTRSTTKGGMLTALERQWDDLKFKYVEAENAKKDAEIERLKNEVSGIKIINEVNNILKGSNND